MNLWGLECFVVLAQELHFGRAAKRLHISQPGLSQQIKTLERHLGVRLFSRSGGTKLAEAGQLLLEDAVLLLERARVMKEKVSTIKSAEVGTLRVVYTRSLHQGQTDSLIRSFRIKYPNVEIVAETAWTAHNVELIQQSAVDIAFVRLPLSGASGIESYAFGSNELLLAVPSEHPLTHQKTVQRSDLRKVPLVHWPRAHAPGNYDAIMQDIWGPERPTLGRTEPDVEHRLAAVLEGEGCALVNKWTEAICPPGVALMRFSAPAPFSEYGLAWSYANRSPVAELFIGYAKSYDPVTS